MGEGDIILRGVSLLQVEFSFPRSSPSFTVLPFLLLLLPFSSFLLLPLFSFLYASFLLSLFLLSLFLPFRLPIPSSPSLLLFASILQSPLALSPPFSFSPFLCSPSSLLSSPSPPISLYPPLPLPPPCGPSAANSGRLYSLN